MSVQQIKSDKNIYNEQDFLTFGCRHELRAIYQQKEFCKQCGIFLSDQSVKVYKTMKMRYNVFYNPIQFVNQSYNYISINYQNRTEIIEFLQETSEKLKLSIDTMFLAMLYLDHLFSKSEPPQLPQFLYALTSLMVAAKAHEKDDNIPLISQLKRSSILSSHQELSYLGEDQYKLAEQEIIKAMNWKLQQNTILAKIEQILSFGVVDDDDQYQETLIRYLEQEAIFDIVREIEQSYLPLALNILKESAFIGKWNNSLLPISCVAYLRRKAGLLNLWPSQLKFLIDVSECEVEIILKEIEQVQEKYSKDKKTQNNKKLSYHSYLENNSQVRLNYKSSPLKTQFSHNAQNQNQKYLQDLSKKSIETSFNRLKLTFQKQPFQSQSQSGLALTSKESQTQQQREQQQQQLSKPKSRKMSNQFSYLNLNENANQFSYLNNYDFLNLDKKFEKTQKATLAIFKTKLSSNGLQM